MAEDDQRTITVEEPVIPPADSRFFAWLAMVPFATGALAAWLSGGYGHLFALATVLWAATILGFFSGVRRGVSFRTPGGARPSQIAVMLLHFFMAFLALSLLVFPVSLGFRPLTGISAALLAAGFASLIVLDPSGARKGTMPLHFARLRPYQIPVAVLSLVAIAALSLRPY